MSEVAWRFSTLKVKKGNLGVKDREWTGKKLL